MCKKNIGDVEQELIKDGYRVRVHYYHGGNSDDATRSWKLHSGKHVVSKYITQAVVYDGHGMVVGVGLSSCSPKDNPVRRLGRHLAVVKAAKNAGRL